MTVKMDLMTDRRERLRATFESVADRYDQARPSYPAELLDALVSLAGLRPGSRLLEVGCGTGKATVAMARRGFAITGVELGPGLAEQARRNLARFSQVNVVTADFESYQPAGGEVFDLVYAATAWHWIDPAIKYRKAWRLLRPGGHLAFWEAAHVFPDDADPIFRQIQPVYDEIGEGLPADAVWIRPGELADSRAELEVTGLFDGIRVRHFDWETRYDADGYIALLDTFSNHIAMEPRKRDRLYAGIRELVDARADGLLRRHWGAVLHVARRG